MDSTGTRQIVMATMGLAGFALALLAGMSAQNPFEVVVTRALVSMGVCAFVGLGIGAAAEAINRENLGVRPAGMSPERASASGSEGGGKRESGGGEGEKSEVLEV